MSDIVERLRSNGDDEAADEIERLRDRLRMARLTMRSELQDMQDLTVCANPIADGMVYEGRVGRMKFTIESINRALDERDK